MADKVVKRKVKVDVTVMSAIIDHGKRYRTHARGLLLGMRDDQGMFVSNFIPLSNAYASAAPTVPVPGASAASASAAASAAATTRDNERSAIKARVDAISTVLGQREAILGWYAVSNGTDLAVSGGADGATTVVPYKVWAEAYQTSMPSTAVVLLEVLFPNVKNPKAKVELNFKATIFNRGGGVTRAPVESDVVVVADSLASGSVIDATLRGSFGPAASAEITRALSSRDALGADAELYERAVARGTPTTAEDVEQVVQQRLDALDAAIADARKTLAAGGSSATAKANAAALDGAYREFQAASEAAGGAAAYHDEALQDALLVKYLVSLLRHQVLTLESAAKSTAHGAHLSQVAREAGALAA